MMFARRLHRLQTAGSRPFISTHLNLRLQELRNISREQGMGGDMPDTKLLKELGYEDLVRAIRKKHGGVVAVAQKMGTCKDEQIVEMHKKVSARAKRRQKRQIKLNQHEFY
ncbi:hypothetical protein BBO99_00001653 [Phytophthora kernoviae]|uniref:Uncharacterized protein n=2 Tax=Phytophthora kernoviae TaxID=325452 RepID=A0A3R7GWM1_9STRA|nr:hypothetical protein G195_002202 [Phytophthora kernoviae 00238/432]KAG2531269.1 hypothetical protein JM16_001165 [Phytophthora kernoviae]KAG2531883.1 hypothetical protein JM18_001570 [Phytophthora kernoviae]RLN45652.1 hypothetical protein BBI17_001423 [Phytophthora kernoviae]RLN84043.1 hypothetical protein BBO99_00001653 [Phytophthora kernoviae]